MITVEGWTTGQLGQLCSIEIGGTPSRSNPDFWDSSKETSNRWVSIRDLNRSVIIDTTEYISDSGVKYSNVKLQNPGTVLLSFKLSIGRVAFAGVPLYTNEAIAGLNSDKIDQTYLFHGLHQWDLLQGVDQAIKGATLNKEKLKKITFEYPQSLSEQTKIAEVLSTVNRAIEQTEALIAKQQRIKTGLMQDLLTRGIDEHGNLRSEQTHKFKDSPLGRIPVEWEVDEFGDTVESAVDGPFGSNLKSDHYVAEPGVRVIRLGNIGNGKFLDEDKAWISNSHGRYLSRHAVQPMDLLIASLGDERHPFGRACIYTDCIHEAVVKADVFRVRCKRDKFDHSFAVHLFNFPRWRRGLFGLAQGVTRDRVNLTNMLLLQLPTPSIVEQKTIARTISSIDVVLDELEQKRSKLHSLKSALMHDLLTGKKRVAVLLKEKSVRFINS